MPSSTVLSTEALPVTEPPVDLAVGVGWLPAALNGGHRYPDRVDASAAGQEVSAFYAARYHHSDAAAWRRRLAAGEIRRNGQQLRADVPLAADDRLEWHRPPWQEGAVPALPSPLFDDGDLLAFNKPSGLPVLPAGGWLVHTVLGQLERQIATGELDAGAGSPRPVHRLGRFTSGLLVCARRPATRAWLSALMRDSTAGQPNVTGVETGSCRKTYRARLQPPLPGSSLAGLEPGESLELTTPIGRRPHARLGSIWAAACGPADPTTSSSLAARSTLTLLRCTGRSWLVELMIATGRPHQIRIHTAAAGAPLLGDPLYGPGGLAHSQALPGDGGYQLHAHRLRLPLEDGRLLELEAPLPAWASA